MKQLNLAHHNLALVIVCVITATGCSSLSVRTGSIKGEETVGLYAGTRIDARLTASYCKDMFDREIGTCVFLMSPVLLPLCIGATTLSAALDTICLPYDMTHRTPTPVVKLPDRQEIQKLREIWPEAYFTGDIHPSEGSWLCNAILNSVKLEHYHQCRQIVLDCGWLPDEPVSKVPSKIPGPFTTVPETFHRNSSVLTLFYMDCGVRLRSK